MVQLLSYCVYVMLWKSQQSKRIWAGWLSVSFFRILSLCDALIKQGLRCMCVCECWDGIVHLKQIRSRFVELTAGIYTLAFHSYWITVFYFTIAITKRKRKQLQLIYSQQTCIRIDFIIAFSSSVAISDCTRLKVFINFCCSRIFYLSKLATILRWKNLYERFDRFIEIWQLIVPHSVTKLYVKENEQFICNWTNFGFTNEFEWTSGAFDQMERLPGIGKFMATCQPFVFQKKISAAAAFHHQWKCTAKGNYHSVCAIHIRYICFWSFISIWHGTNRTLTIESTHTMNKMLNHRERMSR